MDDYMYSHTYLYCVLRVVCFSLAGHMSAVVLLKNVPGKPNTKVRQRGM